MFSMVPARVMAGHEGLHVFQARSPAGISTSNHHLQEDAMSSTRDTAGSQRQRGWLSLRQAATIYGVSVDTLRRRIRVGKLPARRFGPRLIRVQASDVEALLRPIPTIGTIHARRSA